MMEIEEETLKNVKSMVMSKRFYVNPDKAIAEGIATPNGVVKFSDEQAKAISVATNESSIVVIQGRAGVGKSTLLTAVRKAYEAEGYNVQGIALAGVAAQNLEKESGIQSKTIASWFIDPKVNGKSVVILDEAGMVGSLQMVNITRFVKGYGGKLILVGDERQLQPINAGGILHTIDQHIIENSPKSSSIVADVRRQKEEWMKKVVVRAAQGKIQESLAILEENKKIKIFDGYEAAKNEIVTDYIKENSADFSKSIVITNQTADTKAINTEIRARLLEAGIVDSKSVIFNNGSLNIELAKGDRVIFTKNDYKLDVRNGQRGDVLNVDLAQRTVRIKLDNGDVKAVDLKAYHKLDYGWAATTHKSQGITVERAKVFGYAQESMASRQSTYVQISRAKEETKLYVIAGERSIERENTRFKTNIDRETTIAKMNDSWGRNAVKHTVTDILKMQGRSLEMFQKSNEQGMER